MIRRRATLSGLAMALLVALWATPSRAVEIKRMVLDNGAVLLVSEQHQLPMVTLAIAFDAGARRDPDGKAGLASLTARCLTLGAGQLNADQFNQKVDFMGGSLSVQAGEDFAQASFTSLKKYEPQTLALLADVIRRPALHDDDILRKRAEVVAAIKAAEQQPGYVAGVAFRKQMFGDRPYGHSPDGSTETVGKLTPDEVRDFYHQYYKVGSAVIAVVGDVDANHIKAELEKQLAGSAGKVAPQPAPQPPKVPHGVHLTIIDRNVAQANIIMGFPGMERSNPDFYRFQVMNYVLGGGGFASRLMQVVRSHAGLAYSIGSSNSAGKFTGAIRIELQTKNRSANEALKLIMQQLARMRDQPVTDAELAAAKKFLIGSFPLKFDRQSAIAGYMLDVELYGLGLDYLDKYPGYIKGVTREEVQEVARKYLHPDAMILVAVANQSEAAIKAQNLKKAAKDN
jgi:zinc protease